MRTNRVVIYFVFIILFLYILVLYILWDKKTKQDIQEVQSDRMNVIPSINRTPRYKNILSIEYKGITYNIAWFLVKNSDAIFLLSNYEEKLTAKDFIERYHCSLAINGGFYSREGKPIGMFYIQNELKTKNLKNALLNTYIVKNKIGKLQILEYLPEISSVNFVLQTGPSLKIAGQYKILALYEDEYARRSMVGILQDRRIIFLTVYNKEMILQGPLLTDLPAILKIFEKDSSMQVEDVANLDGGSASAFKSKEIFLEELTPVGSFFLY